jgi:hypothetical protein
MELPLRVLLGGRAGAVRKDDPSVPDRALDRYDGAPPDRGRDRIPPPGDRVGITTAGFRRTVPLRKECVREGVCSKLDFVHFQLNRLGKGPRHCLL